MVTSSFIGVTPRDREAVFKVVGRRCGLRTGPTVGAPAYGPSFSLVRAATGDRLGSGRGDEDRPPWAQKGRCQRKLTLAPRPSLPIYVQAPALVLSFTLQGSRSVRLTRDPTVALNPGEAIAVLCVFDGINGIPGVVGALGAH